MIQPILMGDSPVTGWAQVQPTRYASRPPRYLQALGELDDAWDNFNRFATLLEEGKPVEGDFEAATRAVVDAQKKVSRIYYELNLTPLVPDETCTDNGVNRCMCAACHPEYDPDAPIPFEAAQ